MIGYDSIEDIPLSEYIETIMPDDDEEDLELCPTGRGTTALHTRRRALSQAVPSAVRFRPLCRVLWGRFI